MKIAIVGTGAMGSVYAGLLADAGNEVWAVDAWAEHIDTIAANGLRVEGASGDTFVVPRKSLWAENGHVPEDDEGDRWFCWTHVEKSYRLSGLPATEEALEAEPEPQGSGDVEEPDEGEPPVQP
mgnify:CR=1 FL=1